MPKENEKPENLPIPASGETAPDTSELLKDLRQIVAGARERAAYAVNRELTLMHWQLGERILRDILQNQRANYG